MFIQAQIVLAAVFAVSNGHHTQLMEEVVVMGRILLDLSPAEERVATASRQYVSANMSAWSVHVYGDRLFFCCPNQRPGTYSTINYVYLNDTVKNKSPKLKPYLPTFQKGIISVFRLAITCNNAYMFFVDDGVEDCFGARLRRYPPRLFRVNLRTDHMELLYTLPSTDYKEGSLFTNIAVDSSPWSKDIFVYLCDISQYKLVAINLTNNTSHTISHPYFVMDPFAAFLCPPDGSKYVYYSDGIAVVTLSGGHCRTCERTAYFCSSGGQHIFSVPARVLRSKHQHAHVEEYKVVGYKGPTSQSNSLVLDSRSGVMFYGVTQESALYCWDTEDILTPRTPILLMRNHTFFTTPNDLELDCEGNLWAMSNNWIQFQLGKQSAYGPNIVVFRGRVKDLIKHGSCKTAGTHRYQCQC